MRFDQFIQKWNGKPIDFDGYYGYQCMDLMHQYILEVLGLKDRRILAFPYARGVYESFPNIYGSQYFKKIPNTPTAVPQKGDIMFFGSKLGPAGHVSVCVNANVNSFNSFDQNFPLGSYCHIQYHTYIRDGVLGWLRPIIKAEEEPEPNPIPVPQEDDMTDDERRSIDVLKATQIAFGFGNLEGTANGGAGALRDLKNLQQDLNQARTEITSLQSDIIKLKERMAQQDQEDADFGNQLLKVQHEKDQALKDKAEAERKVAEIIKNETQEDEAWKQYLDDVANLLTTPDKTVNSDTKDIVDAINELLDKNKKLEDKVNTKPNQSSNFLTRLVEAIKKYWNSPS